MKSLELKKWAKIDYLISCGHQTNYAEIVVFAGWSERFMPTAAKETLVSWTANYHENHMFVSLLDLLIHFK